MKILWVTNIPLPEASILMNDNIIPFGGWLVNSSEELTNHNDIELTISYPKSGFYDVNTFRGKKIQYFAFPPVKENVREIERNIFLENILKRVTPDIVHIFGTEFTHALAMVKLCKLYNIKVVISIQGLLSVIAKHYTLGLPNKICNRYSFRDFLKKDNIRQQQKKFERRGILEREALKNVKHVIGRTTWDKACTLQINPNIIYHHCNESLREKFYSLSWDIKKCERYSIFISQGSYPIKGLHFILESLPIILNKFPNAKLYIAGEDITKSGNIKEKIKITTYGKYIKSLIRKYNLEGNVVFTGVLNETQISERYLKSNVFVCPSSIENSPNSLGEAMLLGLPCVASDVGGVADLINHKSEGFIYQSDAPYMLAHYISEIFKNENLALKFSNNAKIRAKKTHNIIENTEKLLEIYNRILAKN